MGVEVLNKMMEMVAAGTGPAGILLATQNLVNICCKSSASVDVIN